MTAPVTVSIVPPEAGASEVSRNDFQARLAGVGNLGGKNVSPAQKEKKLREACEGFESIFIQKMWEEMRKTLPKSTLMHGREEQFWQGMYDQELAKKMTSAGGIGLADMMYAQLSRNLTSASRTTATDASGTAQRGFTPEAAPMLPPRTAEADQEDHKAVSASGSVQKSAQKPVASIYDGATPVGDAGKIENGAAGHEQQPVQAAPQVERHKIVRTTNVTGNRNSALDLARMAQFEAGTKLGPNTVRPSLQQVMGLPPTQQRQAAAQNQAGGSMDMNDLSIPPLTGDIFAPPNMGTPAAMQAAQAQGMGAQASNAATVTPPAPQKVRYTTNIPSKAKTGKQDLIRMLNVDAVGPNSVAGAGIAAYHAQQANAAGQTSAAPGAGQITSPVEASPMPKGGQAQAPATATAAASQPADQAAQGMTSPVPLTGGQISVRKGGGAASASGIPPLTASDMRPR